MVLIIQNGSILFAKGYGCAHYEFNIPNTLYTKFPLASNTKLFTAIAIMQLQEKGLLTVHDNLSTYIPDFPQGNTITLHHLLTHTSGIANYYNHWSDVCSCNNLEAMINVIKTWPLEFQPGSKYSYSNSGYSMLAYIIEKVSGIQYEAFLAQYIFQPLNMYDSGSYNNFCVIKNKASGYLSQSTGLCNAPTIHTTITLLGNGDIYATANDLYQWDQALYSNKLLTQESIDALFAPYVSMDSSPSRAHGYGCFIDKQCGRRVIEYSGALIGFLSKIMRFIDDRVTIIVLTNVENQNQFCKVCSDLPDIVFNNIDEERKYEKY